MFSDIVFYSGHIARTPPSELQASIVVRIPLLLGLTYICHIVCSDKCVNIIEENGQKLIGHPEQ